MKRKIPFLPAIGKINKGKTFPFKLTLPKEELFRYLNKILLYDILIIERNRR